jgi:hypothetical protein
MALRQERPTPKWPHRHKLSARGAFAAPHRSINHARLSIRTLWPRCLRSAGTPSYAFRTTNLGRGVSAGPHQDLRCCRIGLQWLPALTTELGELCAHTHMACTRVKSLLNCRALKKQKAAYLINGDADPNAPSRVFLLFPRDETIPAS